MAKKQAEPAGGRGAVYAVEMVAIEHLSEDPANARKRGQDALDKIGKYMIGMSVPPKMTEQVARAVVDQWLS